MQASKRCEMMAPTTAFPDDGEHQSLKGLQQVVSRQMSLWLRVWACRHITSASVAAESVATAPG